MPTKKKFKDMTLKERKAYWKSMSKEKQSLMLGKILNLIKNKFINKIEDYKPKPSLQFTTQELRRRGGWGYGTSH